FRAAAPRGAFAYDDRGNTPLLLGAIAVLTIPELLVLDFALWHVPVWRITSALVHVYAIVWSLGFAEAFRTLPHVVRDGHATFRTLFFTELTVALSDVAAVETVELDRRAIRRERRFGVRTPARWVRVHLREPAVVRSWLAPERAVTTFIVAADEPATLARALAP
ncbi:MAG TPA: hypothetical protein VGN14_16100, partial [Candidatus Elarobacter sp.]